MTLNWLDEELAIKDAQGLRRVLRNVHSAQGRLIQIEGKKLLNFCSNNYLGLADDLRLVKAATQAMCKYGFGSGASRLVCGNLDAYQALEEKIARIKKTEAALVFSSGYAANTGIIPALFGREDIIFSDKLNHASIVDGIILSRAEFKRYAHNDMQALEEGLKAPGKYKRRLIVTDSVFSMDGDCASLKEIVTLARRYSATVMVDEAHGFGVLGDNGGGLVEELGLSGQIEIQMGTLSKAAGCFGAYVSGTYSLREYLVNHARSLIYSTALPAAVLGSALCALEILSTEEGRERRGNLKSNADYLRTALKSMGFDTMNSTTPIIPILVKDTARAVAMSKKLFNVGVFVQAIRPPTVPLNMARLRLTVTCAHTRADLDYLLDVMKGM